MTVWVVFVTPVQLTSKKSYVKIAATIKQAPKGTLIQRGGGTGPVKPRQPGYPGVVINGYSKVPIPADGILEDERAVHTSNAVAPLSQKGHF